ncbi:NACHT, LRR and PYD domains-containing protein 3-like isoform X2 [Hydra vulgaris]|uniref:NACHT, LRR and PYD domains-containing protein 3-like isoform X2 n=1 Tax=Hydra vulgaris TaxID=6087 RepID=A0ABM4C4D9_HYDVU
MDQDILHCQVFKSEFSKSVGVNWKSLGRHLNLTNDCLDIIDKDNLQTQEKAYSMLRKWLEVNINPTLEELKIALHKIERMDLVKKVDELKNKKISVALKKSYIKTYEKVDELRPPLITCASVNLLNKFIDLCIVDAGDVQIDILNVYKVKQKEMKQSSYKPISYNEVFTEEKSLLLISGIAGVGKSWLLRKCLLDWANNQIWKNVDFVFYFECKILNQYENISNVKELLNKFYLDFVKDLDINNHNIIFMIDGLDEFKYLDDLINNSSNTKYPIVSALAEIQKYKSVVAGRVYAIDKYQSVCWECKVHNNRLTIQIMGFNENEIPIYIEKNVTADKKEFVKTFIEETPIAKAMASIPFYLSSMCKIIATSKQGEFSISTMTDLYASIFLYFLSNHITKNGIPIYKMMENDSYKQYILDICKIAFELFVENKVIFSKEEIQKLFHEFDKVKDKFYGFIEKIETHLGLYYQFAHLTVMEFCVSVYAYNYFSGKDILANKKLTTCLSMIFGLTNTSQTKFLKFLANLNNSNQEKIHICNKRSWIIRIYDKKPFYETSCENYFVNQLINSGRTLEVLEFDHESTLKNEEKALILNCLINVRIVVFYRPIKFEGWKPNNKIESLTILISTYLLSRDDFEENLRPWFNFCDRLNLSLHDDINFMKDIYKWICDSNVKWLTVKYRNYTFDSLEILKIFLS